ncbi:MAG: hypothetical protein ACRDTE_20070 [Pseudonocardiaceae bacterium]
MSNTADTGDGDEQVQLVLVAREVRAGLRPPADFDAAFAEATIYAQRAPDRPGVMLADLPGKGRWVLVFSTPERLARCVGDCAWLSTTGADLLKQLPVGLGVLLDIQDTHLLPLLPQPKGQATSGKRSPAGHWGNPSSGYCRASELSENSRSYAKPANWLRTSRPTWETTSRAAPSQRQAISKSMPKPWAGRKRKHRMDHRSTWTKTVRFG